LSRIARPSTFRRQGFTLVELLFVVAIIGVLIALLLPAVQAAREASRRMHCTNNMKQLGLALQSFHAARAKFPYAGADYGWCQFPELAGSQQIRNWNGMVLLLPYLEQQAIYDRFDPEHPAANNVIGNESCCAPTATRGTLIGDSVASGNAKLSREIIPLLLCPSDTGEITLPDYGDYAAGQGFGGAKSNYDFSASGDVECKYWQRQAETKWRLFGENTEFTDKDVTDGLSNTIAFAETLRTIYNGYTSAWAYRAWAMVGVDVGKDLINVYSWPGMTIEADPTRLRSFSCAGSNHGSGANVLFADGSIHFLSDETDRVILERLSAMADGEVVTIP
jgi:prepilin-type N-terminal cleavage/methylation domain-containing protein/prepilin-type processing-associated H-X9-DG protein